MGLCASNNSSPPPAQQAGGGGGGGGSGAKYAAESKEEKKEEKKGDAEVQTKKAMAVKKRAAVFAERMDTSADYAPEKVPKSEAARAAIGGSLQEHFLFQSLDDADRNLVIDAMRNRTMKAGDILIQEGDAKANDFFVLEKGAAAAYVGGNQVAEYGPKGSFGELALLYNCPRAATVKCTSSGVAWALDRMTFRHVLASSSAKQLAVSKDALRQVELLKGLTDSQLSKVCSALTFRRYGPGERIINKNDPGDVFYFLKDGTVKCTEAGADGTGELEITAGGEHSYFGERALITDEPRAAHVTAATEVVCMALDRVTFLDLLGPLTEVMDHNLGLRVLRSVPMLKHLTQEEMNTLIDALQRETYDEGSFIIKQGQRGNTFYIIREGSVEVLQTADGESDPITCATLGHGQYFGEQALLKDEPRNSSVRATRPDDCELPAGQATVECFVLSRDKFVELLGPLQKIMEREADNRARAAEEKLQETRSDAYSNVSFEDLKAVKTLGTGTFGRVKLVQHRKNKEDFYAMKILQKAQVVAYRQQANVVNEKEIVAAANHPFILKLICSHNDQNCLYMVLELVIGGELFSLLHNKGGSVPPDEARFYAGCVLDVFQYLHKRDVVYRDLKPENLLIDSEGYVKVRRKKRGREGGEGGREGRGGRGGTRRELRGGEDIEENGCGAGEEEGSGPPRLPLSSYCCAYTHHHHHCLPSLLFSYPPTLPPLLFSPLFYSPLCSSLLLSSRSATLASPRRSSTGRTPCAAPRSTWRRSWSSGRATTAGSTSGPWASSSTRCCSSSPPSPTTRARTTW